MNSIGYDVNNTERAGPKKGRRAFYGRKKDAKKASNRRRRAEGKRAVKVFPGDSIQSNVGMLRTKGKVLKALVAEKTKEREL